MRLKHFKCIYQLFKCSQLVQNILNDLPFGMDMMTTVSAKTMATLKRDMFDVVGEAGGYQTGVIRAANDLPQS